MDEKKGILSWVPIIVIVLTGAITFGSLRAELSKHDKQILDNADEIAKLDRLVDKAVVDIAVAKTAGELRAEFEKERAKLLNDLAIATARIQFLETKK